MHTCQGNHMAVEVLVVHLIHFMSFFCNVPHVYMYIQVYISNY